MLTLLGLWVLAAVPRLPVCTSGDTTTLDPLAAHVRLVQLTSGGPAECRDTSTPRLHFAQRGAEVHVVLTLAGQAPRSRSLPWASRADAALAQVSAAHAHAGLAVLIEGLWAEALLEAPPPSARVRSERRPSAGDRTRTTPDAPLARTATTGVGATALTTRTTSTATRSSPRDARPPEAVDTTTTAASRARATLAPAVPAPASATRLRLPVAPSDERTTARDPPRDVPLAVVLTVGARYRTPAAWGAWLAARVQAGPLFARLGLEPHLDFAFDGRTLALTSWTAGLGGELALQRLPAVRLHASLELVVHELLERARAGDQTTTTVDLTVVAGGSVQILETGPLSLGLGVEGLWAPSARALQIPGGAEGTLAQLGVRAALEARARW
jgi:hypothetical protein